MKAVTYLAAFTLGSAAIVGSAFGREPKGWVTDLDRAFARAKQEKKNVLVDFTGSTWCPPCIEMREQVFSKKEFVDAAAKDFVLVELDFPEDQRTELRAEREKQAEKYRVEGFPTIVLFDSEGKEFHRFYGNEYPDTPSFLRHLADSLERKDLD